MISWDYDHFAWLYNKYWGAFFADNLYHIIQDLVLKHLPHGAGILDLCCGASQLSHALSKGIQGDRHRWLGRDRGQHEPGSFLRT